MYTALRWCSCIYLKLPLKIAYCGPSSPLPRDAIVDALLQDKRELCGGNFRVPLGYFMLGALAEELSINITVLKSTDTPNGTYSLNHYTVRGSSGPSIQPDLLCKFAMAVLLVFIIARTNSNCRKFQMPSCGFAFTNLQISVKFPPVCSNQQRTSRCQMKHYHEGRFICSTRVFQATTLTFWFPTCLTCLGRNHLWIL